MIYIDTTLYTYLYKTYKINLDYFELFVTKNIINNDD